MEICKIMRGIGSIVSHSNFFTRAWESRKRGHYLIWEGKNFKEIWGVCFLIMWIVLPERAIEAGTLQHAKGIWTYTKIEIRLTDVDPMQATGNPIGWHHGCHGQLKFHFRVLQVFWFYGLTLQLLYSKKAEDRELQASSVHNYYYHDVGVNSLVQR